MMCSNCGTDYLEKFEMGTYCFGCGKRNGEAIGGFRSAKKANMPVLRVRLAPNDYDELWSGWNITGRMADEAGFEIAWDGFGRKWLYMPIFKGGKEVHAQLRKWGDNPSKQKYLTRSAPEPGLVWYSWYYTEKVDYAVIVEGILDGVYVGEIAPTIAILGCAMPPERVQTLQGLAKSFVILLDADATKQALTLAEKLGILKSKVIVLPVGDPTDFSHKFLRDEIVKVTE